MPDRLQALIVTPADPALPLDYQGVQLRRKAIDAMQKIAKVDENSVRYKGTTDQATINLGDGYLRTTWQHNEIAVLFYADGEVHKENWGGNYSEDQDRTKIRVSFVRDY